MVRTKGNPHRSSRPSATGRFLIKDDSDRDLFEDIQSAEEEDGDVLVQDVGMKFEGDLSRSLQEYCKKQSKKASERTSAFQAQKKAIYAAARQNSKDLSRTGIAYIENARAEMHELRTQEVSYEEAFQNFERLYLAQEGSISSLRSTYPPLLDELATRRSDQVNAASETIKTNPIKRQSALKMFSKNARLYVEEARENERTASDASALIKHYKNLLST